MAEEQKRKLEIPWATVLPIVAALAGILAQYKPLVSVRPAVPSEKSVGLIADQDVDARLWQDPLGVAQKERAALDADLQVKKVPEDRVQRHKTNALAHRIQQSVSDTDGVLVLAVMLDSGPYLEQAESRLRARQAVLEGLSESGFVPVDGEHIGFVVQEPWPLVRDESADPKTKPTGGSLMFAWEECRAAVDYNQRETAAQASVPRFKNMNIESVFVLWLPGNSFNPTPLGNFAELLSELSGPDAGNRSSFLVTLLGPANSTGLQAMLSEAKGWDHNQKSSREQMLQDVSIICARATASETELRGEARVNPIPYPDAPERPEESIEDIIDRVASGLQFHRTILPDDLLLDALIDELARRQVHVAPWWDGKKWNNGDHVAILAEWDNTYGRSLAKTFEDEARAPTADPQTHHQIDFFRYMRGIDGRLPGDAPKETKQSNSEKTTAENLPAEATEGLNQADYLRRLARRLKEQETEDRNRGKGSLRAVGLLGNDIYDKLMILRALRPEFPDAIFFTNNYDAHFELHEEWDETHNLIIASPFDRNFPVDGKIRIAPFRDSNQTATFAATLVATGKVDIAPEDVVRRTIIFEVGRRGVEKLPDSSGSSNEFKAWLTAPWRITGLVCAALGLILIAAWIILGRADRRLSGGGDPRQKLKQAAISTPVWLLFGLPIVIFGVAWLARRGDAFLEPFKFASGISIWPTEMVRLTALLLAVHFIIKARVDLDLNQKKLVKRFHLGELPEEKWHWGHLRLGLRRWHKEHPEWMKDDAHLNAKEAWLAYLRRNQFWPRFLRILLLLLFYGLFAVGVFLLFPFPTAPTRGQTAFTTDRWILLFSVFGLMVLIFYVVDAIRLTNNLIRVVTGGVTQWDAEVDVGSERVPPLTKEELARYYDITFVAERTEVVSRLIWYPLIVLALMIFARSAYFDNWTWPYSLLTILCLNAVWAFGSAAWLRRAAEQLRTEAISKLQTLRVASYKDRDRRDMFDDLIGEIRSLKKGAFAPLSEQPFIRAIILPSGGLGLLAVAERVLDVF